MRIDSHQHFWKYDPDKYSWINDQMASIRRDFMPSDLEPELQKNRMDGSIAVEAFHSETETEFLLGLAAKYSFIKGVVGWVNLNSDRVGERLSFFAGNPTFKGIRHTVYDERGEFLLEPDFQNGISELGKLGLTYDLLVFDSQLPGAIELAKKFPEQPFVLDHLAKPQISPKGPSRAWIRGMKELGNLSNVYCKLSGMVTETAGFEWQSKDFDPFLDVAVEAFGPERLMFGSDWPVCLSAASYNEVLSIIESYFSGYPEEVRQRIMGINAIEFYNLDKGKIE